MTASGRKHWNRYGGNRATQALPIIETRGIGADNMSESLWARYSPPIAGRSEDLNAL